MSPNALYIIAVWVLTGMAFGMLSTSYGACRQTHRRIAGIGELLDWSWFMLAAVIFLVILFWTEWGMFRVWSIVFVLIGYWLWSWLAAPLIFGMFVFLGHGQARLLYYALTPGRWLMRAAWVRIKPRGKPPKKE